MLHSHLQNTRSLILTRYHNLSCSRGHDYRALSMAQVGSSITGSWLSGNALGSTMTKNLNRSFDGDAHFRVQVGVLSKAKEVHRGRLSSTRGYTTLEFFLFFDPFSHPLSINNAAVPCFTHGKCWKRSGAGMPHHWRFPAINLAAYLVFLLLLWACRLPKIPT